MNLGAGSARPESLSVNNDIFDELTVNVKVVGEHKEFADIQIESALELEDGGHMAAFDKDDYKAKIERGEDYVALFNLAKVNTWYSADPGVPISKKQMQMILERELVTDMPPKKWPRSFGNLAILGTLMINKFNINIV